MNAYSMYPFCLPFFTQCTYFEIHPGEFLRSDESRYPCLHPDTRVSIHQTCTLHTIAMEYITIRYINCKVFIGALYQDEEASFYPRFSKNV